MAIIKKEVTVKVLGENPRRRRKVIKSEVFNGTNYECEMIEDEFLVFNISESAVESFKSYLSKYKNIEIA